MLWGWVCMPWDVDELGHWKYGREGDCVYGGVKRLRRRDVVQLLSPFKLLVLCERITLPLLESGLNGIGLHPPWRLDCALGGRVGEGSVCWDVLGPLGVRTTRAGGTTHHGAGTPAAHILAPCPTAVTPTRKLPSTRPAR